MLYKALIDAELGTLRDAAMNIGSSPMQYPVFKDDTYEHPNEYDESMVYDSDSDDWIHGTPVVDEPMEPDDESSDDENVNVNIFLAQLEKENTSTQN